MPGPFKLDHLKPLEPLLYWNFSNFSIFILGDHSHYPRGPIMRKAIHPTQEMDETEGFECLSAEKSNGKFFNPKC